jgi:hypothetical protein
MAFRVHRNLRHCELTIFWSQTKNGRGTLSYIDIELVPESRRSGAKTRASMLMHAQCISADGSECTIRVRNLSDTGLGGFILDGVAPLTSHNVTLIIRYEHRMAARVIWLDGARVGIAFAKRFDVTKLTQRWNGPGFEVADLHARVGTAHKRPALRS